MAPVKWEDECWRITVWTLYEGTLYNTLLHTIILMCEFFVQGSVNEHKRWDCACPSVRNFQVEILLVWTKLGFCSSQYI